MTTTAKGSKPYRCSFCGKSQDQVRKLIAGQGVYICDECITLCREIVDEEFMESPKARAAGQKIPIPRRINEILDSYVIGQDRAKRVLSVAVYNHYKRVGAGHRVDEVELGKSNVLLIGPPARGKPLPPPTHPPWPARLYPPIPKKNPSPTNIEKTSGSGTALVTAVANAAPRRESARVVG